ncbi:MAG: peptide-methionine (S)-S-oxide reductase MsrA [Patescibacteria group bacterium]
MMALQKAMFGAGCFWGVQYYFDQIPGVIKSSVGYSGGNKANPSYEDVCTHTTGHAEVVMIEFDPQLVSYETLVKHFFRMHDPTQLNRQGPDIGDSYRSAIFYFDNSQQTIAEAIRDQLQPDFQKPIVTQINPAGPFYEAEDYHQKFSEKTGQGMCHIPYKAI